MIRFFGASQFLVPFTFIASIAASPGCATALPQWHGRALEMGHVVGIGTDSDPAKARSKAYRDAFFRLPPTIRRSLISGEGNDLMLSEVQSVTQGNTVQILYKVSRVEASTG